MRWWRIPGPAVVIALALAAPAGAQGAPGFVAPDPPRVSPGLGGESAGPDTSYVPRGRMLADSGFRPWVHGLSFENYTNAGDPVNLTPVEVQDLFGPGACISGSGADCVLVPPMRQWMEAENAKMRSGHCVGFSVTALRMFQRSLEASAFGAPAAPDLQIRDNPSLQARIAEGWSTQQLPSVYEALVEGRPGALLARLTMALRAPSGETYTMGITSPSGAGHAITPFAVERVSPSRTNVLVYDNNYPSVTRIVEFDTKRDTWLYHGDRDRSSRVGLYSGSARQKRMFLLPTSPGTRRQPCPSCASVGAARRAVGAPHRVRYDQISLTGDPDNHGHLLLTDRQGRRTGFVRGRIVNRIPGVHVVRHLTARNWRTAPEPTYRVPVGSHVSVTVDGRDLARPTVQKLTLLGPHDALTVRRIHLRPGQRDRVLFRPDGSALEYDTTVRRRAFSPVLGAAVTLGEGPSRAAYELTVVTRGLRGRLDLGLSDDRGGGTFAVDTGATLLEHGNARGATLRIRLERLGADGSHATWTGIVPVRPHEVSRIGYRQALDGSRSVPIVVRGRDGRTRTIAATPRGA
jgi:hypothetical protein